MWPTGALLGTVAPVKDLDERDRAGRSALGDHAAALAAHARDSPTAPVDDLLAELDIPSADLDAWEATRSAWAGAPETPDRRASLDHLVAVLDSLHDQLLAGLRSHDDGPHRAAAGLSVHDAIGWICAAWSTRPGSESETLTDVIVDYGARPGAWLFHAAGIRPDEVDDVAPEAVAIVELIAAERGAHLPPRH